MAYLLHFEGSSVEITIFPFEFRRSRIILSIVFATHWESVHEEVLELVHPSNGVLIKKDEVSEPPVEDIICKDIELDLLRLVFKYMHALLEISCEDPSRFFIDLNADDRSLEVLVLDLSQQLLLAQLVNP